ncbi:MAG: response regulator [Eubacterium sp.]|nr:response regulator [Eubacterium sp.]
MFLVEDNFSFVTGAIKEFLKADGVEVLKLGVNDYVDQKVDEMPGLIVTEAEILLENPKARVYLYDCCIEQGCKMVVIGEDDRMEQLMRITSSSLVAGRYLRPVNAREIASDLKEMLAELSRRQRRKKILIVDDSPTFLRTASEWLENKYNTCVCPSAFAAIEAIPTQNPDLILLDYEMPVCSGAQFLQMMNSESRDIPVIFLTSKSDSKTVKEVMALRPKGYLLKTQPKDVIVGYIDDFFEKEKA